MSEIQTLTLRTQSLSQAVDFWNLLMLWGLALAFLAAGFIAISTRNIVTRSGQLTEAQNLLNEAKERQLKIDLALAEQHAAEANAKTEGLRLELAQEIEKNAPRRLTDEQRRILVTELRGKIPSITFVIQRDVESRWFALQLEIALQDSGAILHELPMRAGEVLPIPAGVMMYRPGGAASEDELKDDPLYIALKKAGLFGGYTSQPFASFDTPENLEGVLNRPMLPTDEYTVYVGQKLP